MMRYGFPLLMALTAMLLQAKLLQAKPLQAETFKDYHAVYRILPVRGEKPIGEHRVTQRWDQQHSRYVQQASIAFSWRVLLNTHHYRYQDEVFYGVDNSLSYRISEDNDGNTRTVKGEMPAKAAGLTLNIADQQGNRQKSIDKTQFEYTLFSLRFPIPCHSTLVGTERSEQVLVPISGDIVLTQSRYVSMTDLHLPGIAKPFNDLCLIETTDSSTGISRHSWINRDGYLVYEISADYRLLLVEEASNLPSNYRGKP
ncbi:hypothetical protein [Serratia sp. DD3]|uniref:hypothetical protein n=1 Tax=Serratia sp. DD3 TaxID=1410619 RepID=UPI0003C4EF76|nr:hypothetical protein [Serratia sp. DD3]KEY57372.1 hypothetical protein SRDD_37420 [Serratia sp. DD3]